MRHSNPCLSTGTSDGNSHEHAVGNRSQGSHMSQTATLATVTVTFNPELDCLRNQLAALPQDSFKLIVDNASQPEILRNIRSLVLETPNTYLLLNERNFGLAAAINRGVYRLREAAPSATYVLLLDQDTEPTPGSVGCLLSGFTMLQTRHERVGCVGPTLRDARTGLTHGFHQCTLWRWKRVHPSTESGEPVRCTNLNGSGTLVPIELFLQLGGLEEAFFIDHVDTEWAFRVLASGYTLYGIPGAVFRHSMGEQSIRFWWFGWNVWPARSPQRHYYLFRNAAALMRRSYVPVVWKGWGIAKLLLTFSVHGLFDRHRYEQVKCMLSGLWDGWNQRFNSLGQR